LTLIGSADLFETTVVAVMTFVETTTAVGADEKTFLVLTPLRAVSQSVVSSGALGFSCWIVADCDDEGEYARLLCLCLWE
jgi:hypothetical protein